jgi:hypothetical protein
LCEVNIQIVNTQRVVFPQDLPSEKQLHSCWQFLMFTRHEAKNCVLLYLT